MGVRGLRAHIPRKSDAYWDHTGKLIVSRLVVEDPPGAGQPPQTVLESVTLPDDLAALQKRVVALEQRPEPVGRAFMIATLTNIDLPPNRVMTTLTGWKLSTDGGLKGIQVAEAGFIIQPGAAYLLVLSDLIQGALNQPGLTFQLRRSSLIQAEFNRPPMLGSPSSYQTMWPYLADMLPNDILVVNAANTNTQLGYWLDTLRAVWVEIARY